jgi:hypothetical protein
VEFTPDRLKELLQGAGLSVTGDEQPFAVRSGEGPVLHVSVSRGGHIETVIRGLVGRRRRHRTLIPGCDTIEIAVGRTEAPRG